MTLYKINGVEFLLSPEKCRPLETPNLDTDGNGRPLYGPLRTYELFWGTMYPDAFNQIKNTWLATQTGTVSVDLPEYGIAVYGFKTYAGVIFNQPSTDDFFEGNYTGVKVQVRNVRT